MQDDEWQKALLFLPGSVAETAASSGLVPEGVSASFSVRHAAVAQGLLFRLVVIIILTAE